MVEGFYLFSVFFCRSLGLGVIIVRVLGGLGCGFELLGIYRGFGGDFISLVSGWLVFLGGDFGYISFCSYNFELSWGLLLLSLSFRFSYYKFGCFC